MISTKIKNLFDHMIWADSEVWKKVLSCKAAADDEKIKKLLYHLYQVQYAFYFLWNEMPLEIPKFEQFKNLESIAEWGSEYRNKLSDYLLSATTVDKDKIIHIPWSVFVERKTGKKVVPATLEETMLQVASHSTYHRGQINSRFREIGGEPAIVDLIAWVWLGKPSEKVNDVI